jgi:uncharacterized membrane protein YfcA
VPEWLAGALIAFCIAAISTPAGISGAVFLLPAQVSVLHVANPALTPTNLLYNVLATPGALVRFARAGRLWTPLARALAAGSLPGVVVGAIVRVELLPSRGAILLVVAAVLLPLGAWLLRDVVASRHRPAWALPEASRPPRWVPWAAALVGLVGGIYGIGGGSLLAPLLAAAGWPLALVAPAALASTFLTALVGVLTFQLLALLHDGGSIAPEWGLGLALGVGGLLGGYAGAALQPRVPERALRALLGAACVAIAVLYVAESLV